LPLYSITVAGDMHKCMAMQSLSLLLASLLSAASEQAWIGSHYCEVYNADGPQVVVLFHGYLNAVSDYYPLAKRFADLGYAVIVPRDLQTVDALLHAGTWGTEVAAEVRDWAGTRPVGIVGHSMGGGAAMAAAKSVPGLAAFVAMHPAPIVSGIGWQKVRGPILFTTGTSDDGTIGGNKIGATAPSRALDSYNDADFPKALVNVKGNVHASSVNAAGDEWLAVTMWLGCFLNHATNSCEWVRTKMCTSDMLEWCYHYGMQTAMFKQEALQV